MITDLNTLNPLKLQDLDDEEEGVGDEVNEESEGEDEDKEGGDENY